MGPPGDKKKDGVIIAVVTVTIRNDLEEGKEEVRQKEQIQEEKPLPSYSFDTNSYSSLSDDKKISDESRLSSSDEFVEDEAVFSENFFSQNFDYQMPVVPIVVANKVNVKSNVCSRICGSRGRCYFNGDQQICICPK